MTIRIRFAAAFPILMLLPLALGIAEDITTSDGKIYKSVVIQRVEPDGLFVSYQPEGGGLGNAKIKLEKLSQDLKSRSAYDPNKAATSSTNAIHDQAILQARLWNEYRDGTNRIAAQFKKDQLERKKDESERKKSESDREIRQTWDHMKQQLIGNPPAGGGTAPVNGTPRPPSAPVATPAPPS
jgi:hypothetical protein